MHSSNLQAFIAVATTASFSRAAEQLHLTQPAVSKRVASLEADLHCRLFDRIGHNIQLTEAGRALLPRAQHILAELEDCRRSIHNLSGQISGRLSIGTSHHIGLHRLPPVLRDFTARFPDVELDLHFMSSEDISLAVTHGELEIGLITLPRHTNTQLQAFPVWRDPLCFVCAHHHPLASYANITVQQLAVHKALLPSRNTATRELLEDALHPYDIELDTGMPTNYLETIKMMVSIGLGWTLLPRTMIDSQVHELFVDNIQIERTLGIVSHIARTPSNAALQLIKQLKT